jgi:preprotein translocase subunit SecG
MITNVLLIVLAIVSVAMIGVILMQRSDAGGALGMGGGGPGAMMSGRGAANLMTRITTGLAIAFFALALGLSMAGGHRAATKSVIETTNAPAPATNGLPKSIDLAPSIPASTTPAQVPSLTPAVPAPAPAASAATPAEKAN